MTQQYQCFMHGLIPDRSLHHVLERLVILAGNFSWNGQPNLYEHEIVWHPIDKQPSDNRKRSDDLVMRLRASFFDGTSFIKVKNRAWKLAQLNRPEAPSTMSDRPRTWNQRGIIESDLEGDVFAYLDLLGYQPAFEFVRKGHQFPCDALRVCVYQLYKIKTQHMVSSATLLDESSETPPWIMEVTSPLTNAMGTATMGPAIERFATFMRGVVDLIAVDHIALDNKIKYS
ncbi:hypothetical protein SmJEL517_g03716 [Synchytrium microbalum]|uniref:Mediator of RNA polymerase II transcription subunit 18 n=1 Tax=Synchytrium microbalum TaxID=1806994 RepID=A0A507C1R4_9FUNG|nr:uncharacterized protein SmJEL517_g03716 [Synchytrium microbalum]TPX33308.1 hypothetical protein SmJEL517_g03716 [Synchytrium microbalum]